MASLEQLMGQVVRAGNYDLQFYAQWAEEAETATLTTQQAIFRGSERDGYDRLRELRAVGDWGLQEQ